MKKTKQRSAEWFLREIRKSIKADPMRPIRFEVDEIEMKAVHAAYVNLCFSGANLIPWHFGQTEPPPPPPRHIRENERVQRKDRFPNTPLRWRVSFIGPNVFAPAKVIRGTPAKHYKGPREAMEAWCERLDKLRNEFSPEYHVEGRHIMTRRYGDDRMDYEVWRGEDWLSRRYATLYPAEIARLLESGEGLKFAVKMMEPDAARGRAVVKRNRKNASMDAGGRGYIPYAELMALLKTFKAAGLTYPEAEMKIASDKLPRNYSHYKIRARIERHEKVKHAQDFYATL